MARDTSDTDYHGLERPAVGDDWPGAWDDLVETVDANLKISGYKSDRPDSSATPAGAWYEAIDEGVVYRNDAINGWTQILSGGGIFEDNDSDTIYEQTTGSGIDVPGLEINDAKVQAWQDGMIVPIGDGLGPEDAVDPSSTTDPLQAVCNRIDDNPTADTVLLPGGTVNEDTTLSPAQDVEFWGHGHQGTYLKWPDGINHVNFDSGQRAVKFRGVRFQGNGVTTSDIKSINISSNGVTGLVFDNCTWYDFPGQVMDAEGYDTYKVNFKGKCTATTVDSGAYTAMIQTGTGPAWSADTLDFSPGSQKTGSDSVCLLSNAKEFDIKVMTLGGSPDRAIQTSSGSHVSAGGIQYEPGTSNATTDEIVTDASGTVHIEQCRLGGAADVNYAYGVYGSTKGGYLGPCVGDPNLNTAVINQQPAHPIRFNGPKANVTDSSTGLSEPNTVYAVDGAVL